MTRPALWRLGPGDREGNTEAVGRDGHHQVHPRITPRLLTQWLLPAAVLAGLFGMHVLTVEDSTGGHGALPQFTMTGHGVTGADTAVPAAVSAAVDGQAGLPGLVAAVLRSAADGMGGHGDLGSCILFLVVGGAALLLAWLAARRATQTASTTRPAGVTRSQVRRRGPPGRYRPRVALCVIRT